MEILMSVLFIWLFFKVIGLLFRVAWGTAKIVASVLLALAVPLLFAGLTDQAAKWAKPSLDYAYEEGLLTAEDLKQIKTPMKRLALFRFRIK